MFLHLEAARPLGGYRIEVRFNDGRQGIADLAEVLKGPVFEPLQDPDAFKDFRIDEELRTIVWSNGADLAPEYLYYQAFRDDPKLRSTFRKWGYAD